MWLYTVFEYYLWLEYYSIGIASCAHTRTTWYLTASPRGMNGLDRYTAHRCQLFEEAPALDWTSLVIFSISKYSLMERMLLTAMWLVTVVRSWGKGVWCSSLIPQVTSGFIVQRGIHFGVQPGLLNHAFEHTYIMIPFNYD